ncbi:MAG: hypothetical protein ACTSQ8_07810 [Candidatus Helarchaeota archaeon]
MRFKRGTITKTISFRVPEDLPSGVEVRDALKRVFNEMWNKLPTSEQKKIAIRFKEDLKIVEEVLK